MQQSAQGKRLPGQHNDTDLIVDDASLNLDVDSKPFFPMYTDDYSNTAGLHLSPHACLLVVVTTVEVLSSSKEVG
jgi:hypothetical protein